MEETYRDKPKKAEKWENGRQTEKVRKCPKNKEKPRKSEISKELKIYDSSTFHLPRQCLRDGVKSLEFIGFLGRQRRNYTLFIPLEDRIGKAEIII